MRVFKKDKLGFTMIELMVVMTIIAIIFAIGVSAFINSRDYSTVEESAQALLSTIREAQNKAVGVDVTGISDPSLTPKIWNVEIIAGVTPQFSIFSSYYNIATGGLSDSTTRTTINPVTKYTLSVNGTNLGPSDTIRVSYSSPYGKTYICTKTPGACYWEASSRPENDWEIPFPVVLNKGYVAGDFISETNNQSMELKITIQYKTLTKEVNVKSNGDSYVQ